MKEDWHDWHDLMVTRTGLARSLVGKRTRATHHIAWKPRNSRDGHACEDDANMWKRLILRRKALPIALSLQGEPLFLCRSRIRILADPPQNLAIGKKAFWLAPDPPCRGPYLYPRRGGRI